MKTAVSLLVCFAALAASRPVLACDPLELDLIAGHTRLIGTVTVSDDETSTLWVDYDIDTTGWDMTAVHVYAGLTPPARSGFLTFPYQQSASGTTATVTVPYADLGASPGDAVFIAAHADARYCYSWEADWDALADMVPADLVAMKAHWPGAASYFDVEVSGGDLDGSYEGWCLDADKGITNDLWYEDVEVYGTWAGDADFLVEYPENFDLVDYLLSLDLVGETASCGGSYTIGDVQRAIWQLLDDSTSGAGLRPWKQCRADELEDLARADGEGYLPECGDPVGLVLRPVEWSEDDGAWETAAQPVLITVEMPCKPKYCEFNAWADGDFPLRTGWGSYFEYDTCAP